MRCPMSGQVLKMKDLISVKFTPINDRDNKTSLITKSVSVHVMGVSLFAELKINKSRWSFMLQSLKVCCNV